MNYIKSLEAGVEAQRARIDNALTELNSFLALLHSEKFLGVDSAGERKDWIATEDVIVFCRELRSALL